MAPHQLPHKSDFTFESEDDKFHNAHHAHQTDRGTLLMFDNGNMANGGAGRATRALECVAPPTSCVV